MLIYSSFGSNNCFLTKSREETVHEICYWYDTIPLLANFQLIVHVPGIHYFSQIFGVDAKKYESIKANRKINHHLSLMDVVKELWKYRGSVGSFIEQFNIQIGAWQAYS